jgi:hypothetical protein
VVVDRVADLAFECAECGFAAHAFVELAVIVGVARSAGIADLGDGCHMDGVVELAVAATGESVDASVAGGDLDRCGAGVGGEVISAGEAVDVADEAEHRRGDYWSDAVDLGEGGLRGGDDHGQAAFDLSTLVVDAV